MGEDLGRATLPAMRYFILSLLSMAAMPSTAAAWEFTPGLPCLLTHGEQELDIELTHDPLAPLYTITLRRAQPWPDGQVFSIAFEGGVTISTNRQVISEGGRALTVSDRGFGNVIVGFATSARDGAFWRRLRDVLAQWRGKPGA